MAQLPALTRLFLKISDNLSDEDVRNLRALLTDILGAAKVQHAVPIEIFNMLQHDNRIGSGNLRLLVHILRSLGKGRLADEAEHLEQKQRIEAQAETQAAAAAFQQTNLMSEAHRTLLLRNYPTIYQEVDATRVLDYLHQHGVLTDGMREEILAIPEERRHHRTKKLLDLIWEMDDNAFTIFCTSLGNAGYPHLMERLTGGQQQLMPPNGLALAIYPSLQGGESFHMSTGVQPHDDHLTISNQHILTAYQREQVFQLKMMARKRELDDVYIDAENKVRLLDRAKFLSQESLERRFDEVWAKVENERAIIISAYRGCVILFLTFEDEHNFKHFWGACTSGRLSDTLSDLLITEEMRKLEGGDQLVLKTLVLEKDYRAWKDFFQKGGPQLPKALQKEEVTSLATSRHTEEFQARRKTKAGSIRSIASTQSSFTSTISSASFLSSDSGHASAASPLSEDMAVRCPFTDIVEDYEEKREELLQLYQASQRFIHANFANHSAFKSLLCDDNGPLMAELQRRMDILESQTYQVVFLGTHNSGKSTTINMLLGTELLPKALRHCTDVNCEVRYGQQKKALIYNKSELVREVSLDVENPNKILAGYVRHDRNKDVGSLYDKVEIHWPADLLQSGIVLVDTPGVDIVAGHDSGLWDAYGTRAVAAVFVLDGGYFGNETQIQNLIKSFSNMPDEAAIFTINKWDIVVEDSDSSSESEQVSKDEYNRRCDSLREAWPRLDVESQVLCTKAKEALQQRKTGHPSDDCTKLLAQMKTAFASSLKTRINENTQWLVQFLQKAADVCEKFLNIPDSRGQRTAPSQIVQRYKDGLRRCELKQEITEHLRGKVDLGIKDLSLKLRDFLEAERDALVKSWEPDEEQLRNIGGFDDLENLIRRLVVRKMCDIVHEWDNKADVLKTFELKIISEFQDQFCLMKNELERILQLQIRDASSRDLQPATNFRIIDHFFVLPALMFQSLPTVMTAILNALLFPVTIGKDVLGRRQENKAYAGIEGTATSVLNQRREYVRRKLSDVLTEILNKGHYYNIIRESFQPALDLDELVRLIPKIKTFLQDQITQIEENQFPTLKDQLIHRLADVRLFEAINVRAYSLQVPECICWADSSDPIGEGSFSKVYKATMSKEDGQNEAVAVKVPKIALEANIMDYLREEEILTQLEADCIVKFFGTAIDRRTSPVQLVMVFELCSCTLRERLRQRLNPAPVYCTQQEKLQAMLFAADLAKQTARALRYLHGNDIVHRDLKLDNIFVKDDVTSGMILKLGKYERKIQGTGAGTRLYMAPEILQRSPTYDRKVDIYSFAFILWELWYGRQADHGKHLSDSEFCTAVVTRNLRPTVTEELPSPQSDWMGLIQECWEGKAKMRPSAEECIHLLNSIVDKISTVTP